MIVCLWKNLTASFFLLLVVPLGSSTSLNRALLKEACWVAANLSAGPSEHRNAVLHAGLLPCLAELMGDKHSFDIQVRACLCSFCEEF